MMQRHYDKPNQIWRWYCFPIFSHIHSSIRSRWMVSGESTHYYLLERCFEWTNQMELFWGNLIAFVEHKTPNHCSLCVGTTTFGSAILDFSRKQWICECARWNTPVRLRIQWERSSTHTRRETIFLHAHESWLARARIARMISLTWPGCQRWWRRSSRVWKRWDAMRVASLESRSNVKSIVAARGVSHAQTHWNCTKSI